MAAPDRLERRVINAPALAQAAKAFGPDTAFAVYLLADHHLRVLVSAQGRQEEYRIPVDSAQLQRDIGHFLDDIGQRRDVAASSQRLYAVIAGDVDRFAARLGVHRLALWLDGPLRYIPHRRSARWPAISGGQICHSDLCARGTVRRRGRRRLAPGSPRFAAWA